VRSSHILELGGVQSVPVFKALASEARVRILALLAEKERNINELSELLQLSQPSVTKHVQTLEEAGLVEGRYVGGVQGTQKVCRLVYDRFIVGFESEDPTEENVAEVSMPVGLYSRAEVRPTCGLATPHGLIGYLDDPVSFHFPERSQAEVLWTAAGFVEYVFPNTIPTSARIDRLDLAMEVCSETPGYNNEFPSDITVWVNDVEVGTWRSPGDMGGRRGRLNPQWWGDNMNQYGFLKVWTVDSKGSYIDGVRVGDATISDLKVEPWKPTVVRIGVKPDAENQGGFTLFGKGFGNYEQDLVLRLHHTGRPKTSQR
jgi:predicted transcriptional regulator